MLSNRETEKLCKVMLRTLCKWQHTNHKIADATIFLSLRQICSLITSLAIILNRSLRNYSSNKALCVVSSWRNSSSNNISITFREISQHLHVWLSYTIANRKKQLKLSRSFKDIKFLQTINLEFNTMIIQAKINTVVISRTCQYQLIKIWLSSNWWCKTWLMMKTTEFCFWRTLKKRSQKINLIKFAPNTVKYWLAQLRKSLLAASPLAEVSLKWLTLPSNRPPKQWRIFTSSRTALETTYKLIFINLDRSVCLRMNRRIIQLQILSWTCPMPEHSTPIHIIMVASIDHRQTTTNSMDSNHLHLSISRIIKEIMATAIIHNRSSRTRGPPCLAIISSKTAKETTGQDTRVDQQTSIINIPTTKGKTTTTSRDKASSQI